MNANLFSYNIHQVFVLKFHTIARYQLVSIFRKCKPQSEMGVVDPGALPGVPATPTITLPPPAPPTPVSSAPSATPFDRTGEKEDKQTFQVSDCRSLVKTLVCGVKTITWGITSCKAPGGENFVVSFVMYYFNKYKARRPLSLSSSLCDGY